MATEKWVKVNATVFSGFPSARGASGFFARTASGHLVYFQEAILKGKHQTRMGEENAGMQGVNGLRYTPSINLLAQ